jgi:prepilin-type N-terminal cleavage/methylation domain-containing protein
VPDIRVVFDYGINCARLPLSGSSRQLVNNIVIIFNPPAGGSHRFHKKMKTKRLVRMRGFTLVEIMVVVAIISMLAAIAIPALLRAAAKSQATTCINNLRQIDSAIQQFAVVAGKHVGDTVAYPDDLTSYIKLNQQGQIPPCPAGGTYTLNTVGTIPSAECSLGSTVTPAHVQQ